MKVLVLTNLFPQTPSDSTGVFIARRTAALARLCEVRVVAPRTSGEGAARERLGDVEVLRPRWRRIRKALPLDGFFYVAQIGRIVARLRSEFDFDVLDAHFVYPDGYAAVRFAKRFGRPVVVSARGTDVERLCFWWPTRALARSALRRADRLAAVSAALRERMIEAGADPARIRVIGNGVDTELFCPGPREAARQALGWPLDKRIILAVGALVPVKDYPCLLRAFASVVASHNAHLYIVGDGPERAKLAAQTAVLGLAERVTLLGTVPPRDMGDVYRAADVFCLASQREGCPNVVREALACGVPVVATSVGGTPELIDGDYCGLLVPSQNAEALGRALDSALSASWDADRIAAAPAVRTWDDAARESLALLEEAVAEPVGEDTT